MEVLFQDNNIIVCIKEVGVDSQFQMVDLIKLECGKEAYPVHRLDLNVGGVMVYALNKKTAAYLSKIIQEGKMIKEYVAQVHGHIEQSGVLEDYLFKDSRKNKVFVVKKLRKGVKEAKLSYEVVGYIDDTSLVNIRLYTGRSHQIRVQFASRGYPLIGDHKYGSSHDDSNPRLFSRKLTFPYNGQEVSFQKDMRWQ